MIAIIFHTIFICSGLWFLSRKQEILTAPIFWISVGTKITVGLIVGYYYIHYSGGADTAFLFNQGLHVADEFSKGVGGYLDYLISIQYPSFKSESRNLFFGKIISIPILLGANFWLTNTYLSIVNFLSTLFLISEIVKKYPSLRTPLVVIFLFTPSVLIWSSGIFKETILLGLIYPIFAIIISFEKSEKKWLRSIIILICLYVIFKIKFFLIPPIVIGLTVLLLSHYLGFLNKRLYYILGLLFITCTIVLISQTQHHLDLEILPQSLFKNHQTILTNSKDFNTYQIPFDGTWLSLIIYTPLSLITGLLRPFIFEGSSFNTFYWLETIVALSLSLYSVTQFKRWAKQPILVSALFYICILAIFLTFASANFGTLVRYRSVYWTIYLFIVSIIPFNDYVSYRQRIG